MGEITAGLRPSARGETRITDLTRAYLEWANCGWRPLAVAWLDARTHESPLQASDFVQAVQERQGIMISFPDEIAYRSGLIRRQQLRSLAVKIANNGCAADLLRLKEDAS